MFEQFIIGILWIIGPIVAFVLLLGIVFAEGGVAQTNNMELHVVSKGSMLLLVGLIWLGISSLVGGDVTNEVARQDLNPTTVEDITSVQNAKAPSAYTVGDQTAQEPSQTSTASENTVVPKTNNLFWYLYILSFLVFMLWVFWPSKRQYKGKGLVKDKFVSTIKFEADEKGRRPWHSDWEDKMLN